MAQIRAHSADPWVCRLRHGVAALHHIFVQAFRCGIPGGLNSRVIAKCLPFVPQFLPLRLPSCPHAPTSTMPTLNLARRAPAAARASAAQLTFRQASALEPWILHRTAACQSAERAPPEGFSSGRRSSGNHCQAGASKRGSHEPRHGDLLNGVGAADLFARMVGGFGSNGGYGSF